MSTSTVASETSAAVAAVAPAPVPAPVLKRGGNRRVFNLLQQALKALGKKEPNVQKVTEILTTARDALTQPSKDAVKKAQSPYNKFVSATTAALKVSNPEMTSPERFKECGRLWQAQKAAAAQ